MRFTLGRVVHFYYVFALVLISGLFAYGVKHYWSSGLLNIDYVSNLYDGTSKVKSVKERNDIDEIKKYIDGDRIKEATTMFSRLETDIKDLKMIKSFDEKSGLDEGIKAVKNSLIALQSSPDLTSILNSLNVKVSNFENFVTEKRWPTLMRMSINLRLRISPSRLMSGGLYSFERTQNLAMSVSNDLEAITNFTMASGLAPDIKSAIINRIKTLKDEAAQLGQYIETHKEINKVYKDFSTSYTSWFKQVEPEIAFKKIQFEKSSQTIFYSLIGGFVLLLGSIVVGGIIYNFSTKYAAGKTEKLIIDTIKDGLLPMESKLAEKFSPEFEMDLDKYRDYVHKRMTFGSIFQEAMPFPTILLDSNLNMVWGNSHFYEDWKLENFKEDEDSLTWDFLQRFTDLQDNSAILSALRMSTAGVYKIQVKSNTMSNPLPYEMYVSPVEYSAQKRIMVIFYPRLETELNIIKQKELATTPILKALDLQIEEKMTVEAKNDLRIEAENAGVGNVFSKLNQYMEKVESIRDELNIEIESLEKDAADHHHIIGEVRKSLVSSYESQRLSMDRYNQFKSSVSMLLESRDQMEEQLRLAMNSSREIVKDHKKVFNAAELADKSVDEYIKSLKTITNLKGEFKELRVSVEDFKARIVQILDQLLIFQGSTNESERIDQFLGKFKIEMKGFDKVLHSFTDVVTQLDVTVTKMDMMAESREKIDLDNVKYRLEMVKNNMDNIQFSSSKLAQTSHLRDDELISNLKGLVEGLKAEIKRVNEMCSIAGLSAERLNIITSERENRA